MIHSLSTSDLFSNVYQLFLTNLFNMSESESEVAQSCPTLCDPMDCSLPGSSLHGILQARVLECVAIFLLQGIFLTQGSNPGLLLCRQTLYQLIHKEGPGSHYRSETVKITVINTTWVLLARCFRLWVPMGCSPPGSFVHVIFQARILEWVAISFSRGYS